MTHPSTPATDAAQHRDIVSRLQDEADLCRNDGADDIAQLLDDAVSHIQQRALEFLGAESQAATREAALIAELDAYKKHADDLTHKVICCGVAASHSDPELTTKGAYASKWNSAQAEEVRKLRRERDQLLAIAIEQSMLLGELSKGLYPDDDLFQQIVEVGAALDALSAPAVGVE